MCNFTRCDKRSCVTSFTGTSSSSNSVDITFWILRNVKVINMCHIRNVKSTCSNICCDKYFNTTMFKFIEYRHTFTLCQITMNTFSSEPSNLQPLSNFINKFFCTAKNDCQSWCMNVEMVC